MKSILKVKFIGLDYYTLERVSFPKEIICSDMSFVDIQKPQRAINGGKTILPAYTLTAKEQADLWLSNKSDVLSNILHDPERELNCILNWEIVSIENIDQQGVSVVALKEDKKKAHNKSMDSVISMVKESNANIDKEFLANFAHTFQTMKDSLKGLSTRKKAEIVLSAMGVGFKAAGNAYARISAILDGKDPDETVKKITQ